MNNEKLQKQLRNLLSQNPEEIEEIEAKKVAEKGINEEKVLEIEEKKIYSEKKSKSETNKINEQIQKSKKDLAIAEKERNEQKVLEIEEKIRNLENKTKRITKPVIIEEKQEEENVQPNIQENAIIVEKLKSIGTKEGDFNKIPEWNKLSDGEKLLVIEQLSQDTLSRVKEIGEQKFQEKNKISFSPKNFSPLKFGKKVLKNFGKSYWISKEEKQAIKDVSVGNIKPDSGLIKQIVEKTADMHLSVIEKNGKAFIEFIKIDKSLPAEQQKLIEEYNKVANEYARMPDSWRNKKAANSKDKNIFKTKNYEDFNKIEKLYNNALTDLINSKKEQYIKSGISEEEAKKQAMLDMGDKDFQISTLQFLNTNPDAVQELKNIKEKSSWKRLINNENIWRGLYAGGGFALRSATVSTLGLIAAPLVSGAIGGTRARRKAGQKIDTAFMEGRATETFIERKQIGKKGLFSDKNENRGLISKTLSGKDINAKEVGAFIDADSQIQRLNNLIQKLEEAKTEEEKLLLKDQLNARIGYVENKKAEGLINYGTKNALGTNYELFKKLSQAQAEVGLIEFLNEKREGLLKLIIDNNEARFSKEQASFKNKEMARGAMVAAGFSLLGYGIRAGMHGVNEYINEHANTGEMIKQSPEQVLSGNDISQPTESTINHENIGTEPAGTGKIIESKGIQEFMKTNSTQDAIKLGMYDPNAEAESMTVQYGTMTFVDESGHRIEVPYSSSGAIQTIDDLKKEMHNYYGENVPSGQIETEYTDMKGAEHSQVLIEGDNIEKIKDVDMFDSDKNVTHTEQANQETGEQIENTPKLETQTDLTGKPMNAESAVDENIKYEIPNTEHEVKQTEIEKNEINPKIINKTENINDNNANAENEELRKPNVATDKEKIDTNITAENTSISLTPEQLAQVNQTYDDNIKNMFPGNEQAWNSIKSNTGTNSPVELMKKWKPIYKEGKTEEIPPYVSHLFQLEKETGLSPYETTQPLLLPETPEEFELRCLKKAISDPKIGLEKVTYKK